MAPRNYESMTKTELLELAHKKGLDVTARMRKAEIIQALASGGGRGAKAVRRAKTAAKKVIGKRTAAKRKTAVKKEAAGRAPAKKAAAAGPAAGGKGRAKKAAPRAERAAGRAERPAPKGAAKPTGRPARSADESERTIRQKAVASKYYLGAEEKVMPPLEAMEIPRGYGKTRIVAMARDPYWIFSYWEVTEQSRAELVAAFGPVWPDCRMILRVFDRAAPEESWFDIQIGDDASNWYVNVSPEGRYQVAIGALSPSGIFKQVAISDLVETPRAGTSPVVDDKWMVPDEVFDRIFAASGGYDMHAASAELKELLERHLLEQISSGAVSSFGSGELAREELRGRGFRLWVATELILYGATEPDATVMVQGKEVKLRGDGTFSLRFALPDGKIDLPVAAVSGDGLEERSIDTLVNKKSKEHEPVLK